MEEALKSRILLVEDDADTGFALSMLFEMEGFEVELASDGEEGYERAFAFHPDLIVTDISMPGISGLDLIRLIKSNKRLRNIPVVAMSAVERKQLNRARELGAIAVCQKPVEFDQLFALIVSVISTRRNRNRKHASQNNHC